jgi:photosystem II stability/assembly factor-like uncharacterized protein
MPLDLYAQWVNLGLRYEGVTVVVADPQDGNLIYAGSDYSDGAGGRIFRSTNGGSHWDLLLEGADVTDMVMHPDSSNILYAALASGIANSPGVIKTTDGGATWLQSDSGIYHDWETSVLRLVINPRHPDTLFAGTGGIYGGGLYRTTNGGRLWNYVADTNGPGGANVRGIAINPDSTNIVYASDYSSGRFYTSSDGGDTWSFILPKILYGAGAYQVAFGEASSTIYLANGHDVQAPKSMFKSTDSGHSWSNIANGIPGNYANIFCLTGKKGSTPDELFIGLLWWNDFPADSAHGGGVFCSSDSGHMWNYTGLDSAAVTSLSLSPNGKKLYAGVNSAIGSTYPRGVYSLTLPINSVREPSVKIRSFELDQNYPNPFNSTTILRYDIRNEGTITIKVFDLFGREIRTLVDRRVLAGAYSAFWDGTNEHGESVSSGVYFVQAILRPTSQPDESINRITRSLILMR